MDFSPNPLYLLKRYRRRFPNSVNGFGSGRFESLTLTRQCEVRSLRVRYLLAQPRTPGFERPPRIARTARSRRVRAPLPEVSLSHLAFPARLLVESLRPMPPNLRTRFSTCRLVTRARA
jgi:hypothetical protein